jgi:hypothetical protein
METDPEHAVLVPQVVGVPACGDVPRLVSRDA